MAGKRGGSGMTPAQQAAREAARRDYDTALHATDVAHEQAQQAAATR